MTTVEQENAEEVYQIISHGLLSPPPSSPPLSAVRSKIRKPPPITPKRFTKFFTPRNLGASTSKAGRTLRDITFNASNLLVSDGLPEGRPYKRRKLSPAVYEEPSSPSSRAISPFTSSPPASSPCRSAVARRVDTFPARLQRSRIHSCASSQLNYTAGFYSEPVDIHEVTRENLPFCVQACNTNSLAAIGTESGQVRIVETAAEGRPSFAEPYLTFKPHNNAITDLAFSYNDHYLATGSGDQTGQIVDMFTQQTVFVLDTHSTSLKSITFMPENDKIVATCSRDGVVGLWDLRCRAASGPSYMVHTCNSSSSSSATRIDMYNSIINAHASVAITSARAMNARGQSRQMRNLKSSAVTSLIFLPESRGGSNLFLTSCAESSQIRLWDVRGKYSSRRGPPVPISTSAPVPSHTYHRHFGINSMSLSTDSSRLYAVCKDATIYAYSTNHLVLGQASELNSGTSGTHSRWIKGGAIGAGPLFGMRNPSLRTGSFFVRCSVRRSTDDHTELLAVGSSGGAPVLFSTNERFLAPLEGQLNQDNHQDRLTRSLTNSKLYRSNTTPHLSPAALRRTSNEYGLPLYTTGTPLVRGHSSEVSGVSWTSDGELVSISDDLRARVWRDDKNRARELRICGEGQGQRWHCGWAEVDDASFDDEDG